MWTTDHVRQRFLNFFAENDHTIVASGPLIPQNDPSLLFTAAGMVPFKNYFTGLERAPYKRATSAQKCLRAGGKHNDLDNVGYTARHHTFFEMMGNFSFGDYFKAQAIEQAWQLITREFQLSPEQLVVTVYHDDDEAASLWRQISGLPDKRILRIATDDNFWTMGNSGPCGPCSEIFFDHGDHIAGGPPGSEDADGDRFVEIWNLVFMQYNQQESEGQTSPLRMPLPRPSIDTGSGLERLTAVLQGVQNNYDIDLFQNLIHAIVERVGVRPQPTTLASYRILADHLRASCFLIADGILPTNEGRGYVLRRIMRRAMRHAYLLGSKQPLMHQLVPALIQEMSHAYPELERAEGLMIETLRVEEDRFRETLGRGLKLLKEASEKITPGALLPGGIAFKLYDTYGFPLDLTQDILRQENKNVDLIGFEASMQQQKFEARAHWSGSGDRKVESIWFDLLTQFQATTFIGENHLSADGLIQAIIDHDQVVKHLKIGQEGWVLINQTPFYAESGGQMGDQGQITSACGLQAEVLDTVKRADTLFLHHVRITQGSLQCGQSVHLTVNAERRQKLCASHSATHLLHAVLRQNFGTQVTQKGSLVAPDRLRFDFSLTQALSREQLYTIEVQVNALIRQNSSIQICQMELKQAMKTGAMALFGEKYGDQVRVIQMGQGKDQQIFSTELCGGMHVNFTGQIGFFKIISHSGVASNVRRIEALTGFSAEHYVYQQQLRLQSLHESLKTTDDTLISRVDALLKDKRALEQKIQDIKRSHLVQTSVQNQNLSMTVADFQVIARDCQDTPAKELKAIADQMLQQVQKGIVLIGGTHNNKTSLVVATSPDIHPKVNAIDLVKSGIVAIGGQGGGGRSDMAQAGGPQGDLTLAFAAVFKILEQIC